MYIQKNEKVNGLELFAGISVQDANKFLLNMEKKYEYNISDIIEEKNGWKNIKDFL